MTQNALSDGVGVNAKPVETLMCYSEQSRSHLQVLVFILAAARHRPGGFHCIRGNILKKKLQKMPGGTWSQRLRQNWDGKMELMKVLMKRLAVTCRRQTKPRGQSIQTAPKTRVQMVEMLMGLGQHCWFALRVKIREKFRELSCKQVKNREKKGDMARYWTKTNKCIDQLGEHEICATLFRNFRSRRLF